MITFYYYFINIQSYASKKVWTKSEVKRAFKFLNSQKNSICHNRIFCVSISLPKEKIINFPIETSLKSSQSEQIHIIEQADPVHNILKSDSTITRQICFRPSKTPQISASKYEIPL
ncbi:hypothetical protein ACOSP7_030836 [Xanthoceras sorbifolium]